MIGNLVVQGAQMLLVLLLAPLFTGFVRKVKARELGDYSARVLAARALRAALAPNPALPEAPRLWAALQAAGGGTWAGCVYDTDKIIAALAAGRALPP